MIKAIISGGQAGVDRAALDVAIELQIRHGGFCPRGRRSEDGRIPDRYNLIELATADYPARTLKNVQESDGTLILAPYPLSGGSLLTRLACQDRNKPAHLEWWDRPLGFESAARVRIWLKNHQIAVLNVAGTRESRCPGIYAAAVEFLRQVFAPEGVLVDSQKQCNGQ